LPYYVIGPDGSRYGPVDLTGLNRWSAEGRVSGDTTVELSETGTRMAARSVPGLSLFDQAEPPAQPGQHQLAPQPFVSPYPRQYQSGAAPSSLGSTELALAYVFSILSLVSCSCYGLPAVLLGPVGLILGYRAQKLGQVATAPIVMGWIGTVMGALVALGMVAFFALLSAGALG
jgi:hypothetical protein